MIKLLSDYVFLNISLNVILLPITLLSFATSGYGFESGLALYLRFDEGEGNVALDIMTNGLESALSVFSMGKLPITWVEIKTQYHGRY